MCLVAFGWSGVEWLGARTSGYSPYEVVWTRYGFHLLLMLLVLGPRDRTRLVRTSRPFLQVFRALLMLVMPVCFITAAQRHLDPRVLWAAMWVSVPVVMVVSNHLLGEKVVRSQWVMVGVGLLGTWLMLAPPLPHVGLALALALVAAVSFGVYVVLTRTLRTEYAGANVFHTAVWVFIPLSLIMPWIWQTPSLKVVLAMAGIGVGGCIMLYLLDLALIYAPASLVAPFLFTECLWNVVLSSLRHRPQLEPMGLAGAILIAVSCAWVLVRELRANRSEAARAGA